MEETEGMRVKVDATEVELLISQVNKCSNLFDVCEICSLKQTERWLLHAERALEEGTLVSSLQILRF